MVNSTSEESCKSSSTHACLLFSLAEIQSATRNFDHELIIGEGGFGKVYKGEISTQQSNHVVAIKRLDSMSSQGEVEFRAEIDMLSKLRHCNLVSLVGYCNDNNEMILVYDYMPNGTLYHHLHKAHTVLSCVTRLKIAIGAARGLDYLHTVTGTIPGVIHRGVKTSNIVLDENWVPMISDFGLSKIGPTSQLISYVDASVKGTFGYLDPEYFYTGRLTRKTDVYAFGVVLFELLSGRLAVDEQYGDEDCSLVRWAKKCVKERKFDQMVDPKIKGTILPKYIKQIAQIEIRCVHNVSRERPTMTEVVVSFQALLELSEKLSSCAESSGRLSFTWKCHSYFASNYGQSGTRSPGDLDRTVNQHEESKGIIRRFTYDELELATNFFKQEICLDDKSSEKAYEGWLKTNHSTCKDNTDLQRVAVKKLHYKPPALKMWKEFRHPNLLKLVGYSYRGGCHFLVYEFVNKGNFEELLLNGAVKQLPLVTKVKILIGIARGILFLQKAQFNKVWPKVSESVLDRRKILLDEEFTPKLSDYDGDHYNIACRYHDGDELWLEYDLSGYRLIFCEVITGERIYGSFGVAHINSFFNKCGRKSLDSIAKLCFKICNQVDSESKMLTILKEHDELIRGRLAREMIGS